MKYILYFLLFSIFISLSPSSNLYSQKKTGIIEVTLTNLKYDKGKMRITLYNTENDFPNKPQFAYRKVEVSIKNKKCVAVFKDIPYGVYAVTAHHDENSNNRIDTNWLGIPKEGFGCSNDATGFLGPPSFEDAKFNLNSDTKKISIKIRY